MTEFKLIAYEKESGEVPVEEFLDSVNPKMRAKIYGLLGILQEKGNIHLYEKIGYHQTGEVEHVNERMDKVLEGKQYE